MKILSRDDDTRPQDIADIRALVALLAPDQVELARRGARLIQERGYNRGRDD